MSSSALIPTVLLQTLRWFITCKLWNCLYQYVKQIVKPDHTLCLRLSRFLLCRKVIETARCGQNLLRGYYYTLAQTSFYSQSLQEVQVETNHTIIETIAAANRVVQSPKQSLPILILTFCSGGPTLGWLCWRLQASQFLLLKHSSACQLNTLSRRRGNWTAFFSCEHHLLSE